MAVFAGGAFHKILSIFYPKKLFFSPQISISEPSISQSTVLSVSNDNLASIVVPMIYSFSSAPTKSNNV